MEFKFGLDNNYPVYKIKKPVRLIELFGGIGTQAMALRDINAQFEHYRLVEFNKFSIKSYNAIHGTSFEPIDITRFRGKDLGIVDKDKYDYIVTYSFPCTDLSNGGKRLGMARDSGTRSGLLWEVERILDECVDNALNEDKPRNTYLPQVLVMENVAQVHNGKNMPLFKEWIDKLTSLGYKSYFKDLNAKGFNVAQNRIRCFMVSILGDYSYEFPQEIGLYKTIADYLEDNVASNFYVGEARQKSLVDGLKNRGFFNNVKFDKIICGQRGRDPDNPSNRQPQKEGQHWVQKLEPNMHWTSNALTTVGMDNVVLENRPDGYFVRNLTSRECWRLMSFKDEDYNKAAQVNGNTQLYKQAGNAIVLEVLKAIFKQMF